LTVDQVEWSASCSSTQWIGGRVDLELVWGWWREENPTPVMNQVPVIQLKGSHFTD